MLQVDFAFAKWKRDQLQKKLSKASNQSERHKLEGELKVWHALTIAACKNHEFIDVYSLDGKEIEGQKCVHCDGMADFSDEIYYAKEYVTKGCHNCAHYEVEGGDSVPYGSTFATLPVDEYCTHPITDSMSDEELDAFYEKHMKNSHQCPYWEGREG